MNRFTASCESSNANYTHHHHAGWQSTHSKHSTTVNEMANSPSSLHWMRNYPLSGDSVVSKSQEPLLTNLCWWGCSVRAHRTLHTNKIWLFHCYWRIQFNTNSSADIRSEWHIRKEGSVKVLLGAFLSWETRRVLVGNPQGERGTPFSSLLTFFPSLPFRYALSALEGFILSLLLLPPSLLPLSPTCFALPLLHLLLAPLYRCSYTHDETGSNLGVSAPVWWC